MERISINAKYRDGLGKEKSAKYRQEGLIPGVIYGHGEDTKHVLFDGRNLSNIIARLESESTLFSIDLGEGEPLLCVIKEVQRDKIKRNIIHIDFQHLHAGEKITLHVPVVPVGTAIGVKEGGLLEVVHRELEIRCLPKNIPEHIEINIENLKVGDSIHIGEIELPEGVEIMEDPEIPVITIMAPKKHAAVEETEETAVEEEAKEPEVIKEKKEEE